MAKTRTYWCKDCNDHHEVEITPKPKRKGVKGWKVVSEARATNHAMALSDFLNKRTGEVMRVNSQITERFILRAGKNKGQPIFRTVMTVERAV